MRLSPLVPQRSLNHEWTGESWTAPGGGWAKLNPLSPAQTRSGGGGAGLKDRVTGRTPVTRDRSSLGVICQGGAGGCARARTLTQLQDDLSYLRRPSGTCDSSDG